MSTADSTELYELVVRLRVVVRLRIVLLYSRAPKPKGAVQGADPIST